MYAWHVYILLKQKEIRWPHPSRAHYTTRASAVCHARNGVYMTRDPGEDHRLTLASHRLTGRLVPPVQRSTPGCALSSLGLSSRREVAKTPSRPLISPLAVQTTTAAHSCPYHLALLRFHHGRHRRKDGSPSPSSSLCFWIFCSAAVPSWSQAVNEHIFVAS